MVRLRAYVLHLVLRKLRLEPGLAAPVRVLPAIVRKHLLGNAVLRTRFAVHLKNMLGGLRRIQAKAYEISTVVIHKADQVHLLAR